MTQAVFSVALIAAAFGCADDTTESTTSGDCNSSTDCPSSMVCVESTCQASPGDVSQDTGNDGNDATEDTYVASDVPVVPDVPMTPDVPMVNDMGAPDATETPDTTVDGAKPKLLSSTPADGETNVAVPFVITLIFSEPVKNVDKNTVQIQDVSDASLVGTFAKVGDGDKWTFTPTDPLLFVSPYKVTVNYPTPVIIDQAGNKMETIEEITFFTGAPADLGKYDALAEKYAPTVRNNISAAKSQLDYPTALNLDGDWDLRNNKEHLNKPTTKTLAPTTHYTVLESESHYFVHYVWYWGARNNPDQSDVFENDAAGAMVVIEKWPAERPVELFTWFKTPGGQYVRSFPTTEGGIFDSSKGDEGVTEVYAQADLFVGDRFELMLIGGSHQACLWQYEGNSSACDLNPGDKAVYAANSLRMTAGETATIVEKKAAGWPKNNAAAVPMMDGTDGTDGTDAMEPEVHYALESMLPTWWPRRTQLNTMFYDAVSNYTLPAAAPGAPAKTAKFPRFFLDAADQQSNGRTPWAVIWKPGDNTQYTADLAAGMFFIDPPTHMFERHGTPYVTTAFNPADKTGFSRAWCFNPYLDIDDRGTSEACP
ncbi:MAG: hypothetical protein ACI9OJ_001846 [Myxococcota bacterium]|jgi:hypothetical protein